MLAADGRVCLLGAHYLVASCFSDNGVAGLVLHYLAQAIAPKARFRRSRRWHSITIIEFNDNCSNYNDIEKWGPRKAQELARCAAAPASEIDSGCFEKIIQPLAPVTVRHEVQCIS